MSGGSPRFFFSLRVRSTGPLKLSDLRKGVSHTIFSTTAPECVVPPGVVWHAFFTRGRYFFVRGLLYYTRTSSTLPYHPGDTISYIAWDDFRGDFPPKPWERTQLKLVFGGGDIVETLTFP